MVDLVHFSISSDKELLALHKLNPERYPFLLESLVDSPSSRYHILFAFPLETIRADNDNFLDKIQNALTPKSIISDLPFTGGWFLFLDYELNQEIEPVLNTSYSNNKSRAFATRIPSAIIQDKKTGLTHFISESNWAANIAKMQNDFEQSVAEFMPTKPIKFKADSPKIHQRNIVKIKDYITKGDVFQVNLSRCWCGTTSNSVADLYNTLRQKNPASFAGLINHQGLEILSSSPERLIKVKNQKIETRPIAGTRPRSTDTTTDKLLAGELLINPKEQAEHIMLLDMERNDLGRVCKYGSVSVDELMIIETYEYVHHIVSNVSGTLKDGVTASEIIAAVFPGGTITGCPKVRCMEIINELEQTPRGSYTGSMGYLNHNGDMDLNILIRTLEKSGEQISFRAGGGIVFDSIFDNELNETRSKAKGMMI